jgi:hypothetical protein
MYPSTTLHAPLPPPRNDNVPASAPYTDGQLYNFFNRERRKSESTRSTAATPSKRATLVQCTERIEFTLDQSGRRIAAQKPRLIKYDVFGWTNIELEFVQEDVLARVRTRLGFATQRGFTLSKSSYLDAKRSPRRVVPASATKSSGRARRSTRRCVRTIDWFMWPKVGVCVSRGRWKTRRSSGHLVIWYRMLIMVTG